MQLAMTQEQNRADALTAAATIVQLEYQRMEHGGGRIKVCI